MKAVVVIAGLFLLLVFPNGTRAQTSWIDSMKRAVTIQRQDTSKVWALTAISNYYAFNDPDSGVMFAQQAMALAEKLQFDRGIFWSIVSQDHSLYVSGNYTLELEYALRAAPIAQKLNDNYALGWSHGMLADSYLNIGDFNAARPYLYDILKNMELHYPKELYSGYAVSVSAFVGLHKYDSALLCARKSLALLKADDALYNGNDDDSKYAKNQVYCYLGQAFEATGHYDSALFYYRMSIPFSDELSTKIYKIDALNGIGKSFEELGHPDSAIAYAKSVLSDKLTNLYPLGKQKALNLLADVYQATNVTDSSLKYLRIAIRLKDSIYDREKTIAFQNSLLREKEKQSELKAATSRLQNQYRLYFLIALFAVAIVMAGIVIRNRRIKQLHRIRNSIADDLHDDIGSTLSSINIMSELAKEKSPEALPLLASISESTLMVQENMSDIIWAIKAGNDRLENVVRRMNQFANEILEAKNIALDFETDESLSTSRLNMEQRKNCYLFFKEAINNAAKYSEAGKIWVHITQKEDTVELNIRDDGKGFDTSNIFNGNGMRNLKKRAAELNGDFKITSCINKGTMVELTFRIA